MISNQTPDPIQKILDDELDKIDAKTLEHLRAARREAINAGQPETAITQISGSGQLSLMLHPMWQQKNWLMALALVLCLTWVLVSKNFLTSSDIAADFSFYSEVDPEWLMDLEIAELFGDE